MFCFLMLRRPPRSTRTDTLLPYTTLFRSCDVRSPWQKGGVENAIGRIRRSLPRNANLDQLPQQAIAAAAHRYNHTPRKCLDFLTPAEAFSRLQSTVALQS